MTNESAGTGEAVNASVSDTQPDGEARARLLELAETLEGSAKDAVLGLAEKLITPMEYLGRLADEAEQAAEVIKEKIKGMEGTLQAKLDEAKAHRDAASNLEAGE